VKEDRLALLQLPLKLEQGDEAACEGNPADQNRQHDRNRLVGAECLVDGARGRSLNDQVPVDRSRDQRRGNAAKAVEKGHHLGHRGHLDANGEQQADDGADHHAAGDPAIVDDA
jgi:hypothetical protein